jgi:hypothetical protein
MAGAAQQGDKLNVFISYSRADLDFAEQLCAFLLRDYHRPRKYHGRRRLEEAPRGPDSRRRHNRFRAFAVLRVFPDMRLGSEAGDRPRQAYHPGPMPVTRRRSPPG